MNRHARFILVIFFLLNFSGLMLAQKPIHDVWDTEDGLPSNEVYWVHQDQKGDLWFCTDNGIVRYDGINMKVLGLEDGLPDNVVFTALEDSKGRIWFSCYTGGFFYVEEDSIVIPPFNQQLVDRIGSNYSKYYYINEHDSIFIANHHFDHGVFMGHIEDSVLMEVPGPKILSLGISQPEINIPYNLRDQILVLIRDSLPMKKHMSFEELGIQRTPDLFTTASAFLKPGITSMIYLNEDGEPLYGNSGARLFGIDDDGINHITELPSTINNVRIEENELLVSSWHHGVKVFDVDKSLKLKGSYFDKSISYTLKDRDGVYWLGTINGGVIRMPSMDNFQFPVPNGIDLENATRPISFSNDTLHCCLLNKSTRKDYPVARTKKSFQRFLDAQHSYTYQELIEGQLLNDKTLDHVYTLYRDSTELRMINHRASCFFSNHWVGWHDNSLYAGLAKVSYHDESKPLQAELMNAYFDIYHSLSVYSRRKRFLGLGHQISCSNQGFVEHTEDSVLFLSQDYGINDPVNDVLKLGDMHYLYGTHKGLFEFTKRDSSRRFSPSPLLNFRVEVMEKDERGNIYIGTRGGGLVVIAKDSLFSIGEMYGLSDNRVREMILINDTLWVATDNGLNNVYIHDNLKVYSRYHWLNALNGHNAITNLAANKNEIGILKGNQFHFVKRSGDTSRIKPRVLLEDVLISGRKWNKGENHEVISVSGSNNNLEFHFRINSLLGNPFVYYEYRLVGHKDYWTKSKERKASYQNLPYGTYTFEVRVVNSYSMTSENTEEFEIVIKRPLLLTLWFQLLLGVVFIGLALLVANIYFKRKNRRLMREKEMISSNIFALKMQINPHFIFNALNSIQYFIASDRGRSANEFLSRFSELIRDILRKANQTKVTIREELKSLENYIKLEDTRKKNGLKWKMDIDSAIDTKRTFIPSMILQPIVENAIWHGLAKVEDGGELGISIHLEGDYLICSITDNGPGIDIDPFKIENSGEKLLHKSVGLSNVIQRLKLISKMEGKSYDIHFDNIYPKERVKFRGTIVTLKIPAK